MKKLRYSIIFCLILSLNAFANPKSQYSNFCPGTTATEPVLADLSSELGPVQSQDGAPWCATYAANTLLEQHIYKTTGKKTRLSVVDTNSMNSSYYQNKNDFNDNERTVSLNQGADPMNILEGVQNVGGVYREEQLPFDQTSPMRTAFEYNLVNSLVSFYRDVKEGKTLNCSDEQYKRLAGNYKISNLKDIAHNVNDENAFMRAISKDSSIFKIPKIEEEREKIPPFSINNRDYSDLESDSYLEDIFDTLKKGHALNVSMCFNSLMTNLNSDIQTQNSCGEHAMIVAGAKMENGKCKLLLRNSHGHHWPYILENAEMGRTNNPGGGSQWVDIDTFLASTNQLNLNSIEASSSPDKKINTVRYKGGKKYIGETWHKNPNGHGSLFDKNGDVRFEGNWRNGSSVIDRH